MLDPVSLAADLEAVAAGDEAALRRLWDAAAPTLFSLSLRLTGRRTAAEDALQESFVRIWRKAHRYDRALGDPLGWMAAVTRNVALDQLRRPHARREVTLEDGGPRAEVATQVDLGLADADLRRCLECLPDMQLDCTPKLRHGIRDSRLRQRPGAAAQQPLAIEVAPRTRPAPDSRAPNATVADCRPGR